MAQRGEKEHKVRLDPDRWATLTAFANALVHESEMPHGARPGDPRISPMLRLIADGQIVLTRLGREAPEEG